MISYKYPHLFTKLLSISLYRKIGIPLSFPYKVNFDVTYKCNSECRTCNIWKIYKDDNSMLSKELNLQSYKTIFKNYGNNLFIVSFEGGEPFLRDDISDIVISSFENCKNILSCVIASNGSLPKKIEGQVKTILKYNPNIPLHIVLSLDGAKDIHNLIRGKGDSYSKVMEAYKRLKKITSPYLHVLFQTTICKTNFRSILKMERNIDDNFVFTLAHENNFFNNNQCNESVFDIEDRKLLIGIIRKLAEKTKITNISLFLNKIYLLLGIYYLKEKKLPVKCNASFSTLSFDPYGNVSPCAFLGEKFGNIKDYDFNLKHLLLNDNVAEIREIIKNGSCPKCWMNCDALPSIIHSMPKALFRSLFQVFDKSYK